MARDRNVTVWQAYVTVMSIVSFLCLGTLAYIMFTSGTNMKTAEAAIKDKRTAEENLRKVTERNQLLQSILGVGKPVSEQEFNTYKSTVTGDPEIDAAVKVYTNHMVLFGPNAPEKNYAKLVDTLMQELRARNVQIANAMTKSLEDNDKYEKTITQETNLRKAAQEELEKLSLKTQADLENYTAKIAEQVQLNQKLEAEKQQQFKVFSKEKSDLNAKLAEANRKNDDQARRIDGLVRKIEEVQNENFQYVQGKITEVADGFVWINLGRDHGLRPGVNFIVLDSDVSQVTEGRPKAKVEVVEVVSNSLARAKILDDRAFTTILKEDKVYSPLWQPGTKVQIALLGKMDVDGDGRDDRERLKSLIIQNGAEVVMDAPPGGRVDGKLTEQVRWLVIGEELKIPTAAMENDPSLMAAAKKRLDLETQAKSLGVTRINLNKLWNWLQANDDGGAIGTAARPRVQEYLPAARNNFNSGRVSELFQTRNGRLNPTAPSP